MLFVTLEIYLRRSWLSFFVGHIRAHVLLATYFTELPEANL